MKRSLIYVFSSILLFVFLLIYNSIFSASIELTDPEVIKTATKFSNINEINLGNHSAYVHRYQGFDIQDLINGDFATSIDRVTRVRFWCSSRKDIDITIRCKQTISTSPNNNLIVSVNGKKIGEALMSKEWQNLAFTIPKKQLRISDNILTLETPKGTQKPDIYFDVGKIQFIRDGLPIVTFPQLQETTDGSWDLNPGESLIVYLLNSHDEEIIVSGRPAGNGRINIECQREGFAEESGWLGSFWSLKKTQAVFSVDEESCSHGDVHCTKVTISNLAAWPSCKYKIRVIHDKNSVNDNTGNGLVPTRRSAGKPNIIVVTLDSLRSDALGAYGNNTSITPVFDQMALLGIQGQPSIAAAPYTTSSVASFMTGVAPEIHRVFRIGNKIPMDLKTLAERLKSAGYHTCGVNAMPSINGDYGFNRGFDKYFDLFEVSSEKDSLVNGNHVVKVVKEFFDNYSSHNPFFLYIHMREPHLPYSPPNPFQKLFCSGNDWRYLMEDNKLKELSTQRYVPTRQEIQGLECLYNSGLRYGDMCLGEIIHTIQEKGYWDDSIVILMSDHGEAFWEHEWLFHNDTVFEEMVSIPVIYVGGRMGKSNRSVLDPMTTQSISHDILSMAGIDPNKLSSIIKPNRFYKMQSHGIGRLGPIAFYRSPWKFIGQIDQPQEAQLYHLQEDPGESNNLSPFNPLLVECFQRLLDLRDQPGNNPVPEIYISEDEVKQLQALGYLNN
ncbi:sulfatase-like hydrolase/transferase [bacterium]|nr:sulfatase-like hydrolase/transferase [bacterium]